MTSKGFPITRRLRKVLGRARAERRRPGARPDLALERLEDRSLLSLTAVGPEFRVNDLTVGLQKTQPESPRSVAMDALGDYIVVWTSSGYFLPGAPGTGEDVYGRRYRADGTPAGSSFLVSNTTIRDQSNATVAMSPSGDFVVTWMSNQGGSGYDVYARRYSSTGIPSGGEFRVNTYLDSDQMDPQVGMDDAGNFVIIWTSNGQDGDGGGIFARRYDASGTPIAGEIRANTNVVKDQRDPGIALGPSGDFAIVWASLDQDGDNWGVFGQRYDTNGAPRGGEFRVNSYTNGAQKSPTADMDAAGNLAIVWESDGQDGDESGVFGQRFDAAGGHVGSEFRVNATTSDSQTAPSVAWGASGYFYVAWQGRGQEPGLSNRSSQGIFAREYDALGASTGPDLLVPSTSLGDQVAPSIAAGGGSIVAVWSGSGPGDGSGVFGQRYVDRSILVTPTSGLVTSESGRTARVRVVLTSAPTAIVSIPLSTSDSTEGVLSATSLNFTPANWDVPQSVTIFGVDDAVADGDVVYAILFGPASSADADYDGLKPPDISVTNTDDETPGVTVAPTSGLTTSESGGSATFSVVLNTAPTADVTFTVRSSDPAEGVASVGSITFTAANWNLPRPITVTGVDDPVADGDQGYSIVLDPAPGTDPNYVAIHPETVRLTNIDDDEAGVLVLVSALLATTEAGGTTRFGLVLSSRPLADVTLALASSNVGEGTVSPAVLTFTTANWDVPQDVTVTGVDDPDDDGDVSYSIVLSAAASADPSYDGLSSSLVDVLNVDDDTAGITVTPTSGLVTTEAGGSMPFRVVLNSRPAADVTIAVSSSNAAEGTVSTTTLVFNRLNWNVPQSVTVTGVDDPADDGDSAYAIVLSPATSADPKYQGLDPADVQAINIDDDDVAGVSVSVSAGAATTEAGGTATIRVVLTRRPTAVVTIGVSSSDPSEGTVSTALLTFTPANWDVPQVVTVTGVDDYIDDGDVPYTIVLSAATSLDSHYHGLDPADPALTNIDDDTSGIQVTPRSGLVVTEAGGTATFAVVLRSEPTSPVTIRLVSSAPGEGTISASSLTFTPANWDVPRVVTVSGVDDFVDDGDSAFLIALAPASSADLNYQGLDPADVSVTNLDDDEAGITVKAAGPLRTTEAGGRATFSVALDSRPDADVTIAIGVDDPTEGAASVGMLTFTPANWSTPHFVTISGLDDDEDDGDVPYNVILRPNGADPSYRDLAPTVVSAVNVDDDTTGIVVGPATGLVTSEAGGSATFAVSLSSRPASSVFVSVRSSDPTEGIPGISVLTFGPDDWMIPQEVTTRGVDDDSDDGDVSYAILLTSASADRHYDGLSAPGVGLRNLDDDRAGIALDPVGEPIISRSGRSTRLSVVLRSRPEGVVTIALGHAGVGALTISPTSLTFTPDDWDVPQFVVVAGTDDASGDGDRSEWIVASVQDSEDPTYSLLNPVVVEVLDLDDRRGPVAPVATPPATPVATPPAAQVVNPVVVAIPPSGEPGGLPFIVPGVEPGRVEGTTPAGNEKAPGPAQSILTASNPNGPSWSSSGSREPGKRAENPPEEPAPPVRLAGPGDPGFAALPGEGGLGAIVGPEAVPGPIAIPGPQGQPAVPSDPAGSVGLGPGRVRQQAPSNNRTPQGQAASPREALGTLYRDLDRMSEQVDTARWPEKAEATLVVTLAASVGYVLLNAKGLGWVLSLLLARPLYKDFDPLEVILAWEEDAANRRPEEDEDESLQTIVEGVSPHARRREVRV